MGSAPAGGAAYFLLNYLSPEEKTAGLLSFLCFVCFERRGLRRLHGLPIFIPFQRNELR